MSFASEASKLVTNKYFLYFVLFISVTNVLAYLASNKINAVIFFALVSLISYQFSKNMAVVLLIAVISTNFLMANKSLREGLENESSTKTSNTESSRISDTDEDIGKAIPIVQGAKNNEDLNAKLTETKEKIKEKAQEVIDTNNAELNTTTEEEDAPEGYTSGSKKNSKTSEHFGPRLDYAATIEQSYQNLDNLLGSDSIKQLTNDTQKLMQQQQTLFNTMNQMVPVLEGAQDMLKKFNVKGITDSLKGLQ